MHNRFGLGRWLKHKDPCSTKHFWGTQAWNKWDETCHTGIISWHHMYILRITIPVRIDDPFRCYSSKNIFTNPNFQHSLRKKLQETPILGGKRLIATNWNPSSIHTLPTNEDGRLPGSTKNRCLGMRTQHWEPHCLSLPGIVYKPHNYRVVIKHGIGIFLIHGCFNGNIL